MTLRELIANVTKNRVGDIDVLYGNEKLDYQVVGRFIVPHITLPLQNEFNFSEIKNVFVNNGTREIEITL